MPTAPDKLKIVILIPVYNDRESLAILVKELNRVVAVLDLRASLLIVDDCSREGLEPDLAQSPRDAFSECNVLRLRRNLGHQRAIAVALMHIRQHVDCDAVLIMDADGEDKPDDIKKLVQCYRAGGGDKVVFAERTRRSEGLLFKTLYHAYRIAHHALTGIEVKVGNFSLLPCSRLGALSVDSNLWNHYAATVFRAKMPRETVPTERGRRYAGQSKMNYINLIVHGLSAISVFGETVSVRILIAACFAIAGLCGIGTIALISCLVNEVAIPGWATFMIGILLIIAIQIVSVTAGFVFHLLNSRNSVSFIPIRDYQFFTDKVTRVDS